MKTLETSKIRIDGGTQPRAQIDMMTVADYAEAMRAGAVFPPVTVFYDGADYWLADGFHRYHAAAQVNGSEIACDVRKGTVRDAVLFSVGANATHGMRRTNADKRRAVMALLQDDEWSKWSDRKIAEKCAVGHSFVSELRSSLSSVDSETERHYLTKHGTPAVMHIANIGKRDSDTPEEDDDPQDTYEWLLEQARSARSAGFVVGDPEPPQAPESHQLITQSNSNEWYTPSKYIEAARRVLGVIDLDPASCQEANHTVKADKFYTQEDDGLLHDWPGRVWLNPPYGGMAEKFIIHLIRQFGAGITQEAVVLVNANCIETKWFSPLWGFILCFADHRINFDSNNEASNGPTHGSVFVYLGPNEARFIREFKKFGHVVKEVSE